MWICLVFDRIAVIRKPKCPALDTAAGLCLFGLFEFFLWRTNSTGHFHWILAFVIVCVCVCLSLEELSRSKFNWISPILTTKNILSKRNRTSSLYRKSRTGEFVNTDSMARFQWYTPAGLGLRSWMSKSNVLLVFALENIMKCLNKLGTDQKNT